MFAADNHLDSQPEKRRRADASPLGQPPHTADNHLESQPEKRRRADVSSSGQQPLPKTANKHVAANTPAKTSSTVATGPIQQPPLTSTTPSATPSAAQASKRQATTKLSPKNLVDTNIEDGNLPSLKQSQPLPSSLSIHRISSLPDGNTEPVLDRLSSDDHIPNIGDKQIMPPPDQTERDVDENATEYEPHLDEALWTGVDAAKSAHEQKGSDEDLPEKKSAKVTAMVNLNHGASTGATRVFVTIAKNGDTRFEVTQDNGSES
ncbi:hypothetical protein V491_00204 [Pseudogymnoascus sp. VKM F-3775]|nr:hypothetical protein V491_00204 [Pseudogymnoascus sp. VKM F-3775]